MLLITPRKEIPYGNWLRSDVNQTKQCGMRVVVSIHFCTVSSSVRRASLLAPRSGSTVGGDSSSSSSSCALHPVCHV